MVFEKLRAIICEELELSEEVVTMDSDLMEDFDADSIDLVEIASSIEDEFNIEVSEDVVENFKTVGDVVKFIEENM